MPVKVSIWAAAGEKVVMVKGETMRVLLGFLQMVSIWRLMTELAGSPEVVAIFVKFIW